MGRVDVQFAQSGLFVFDRALASEQWANVAVTGVTWRLLLLVVGLALATRADVK